MADGFVDSFYYHSKRLSVLATKLYIKLSAFQTQSQLFMQNYQAKQKIILLQLLVELPGNQRSSSPKTKFAGNPEI